MAKAETNDTKKTATAKIFNFKKKEWPKSDEEDSKERVKLSYDDINPEFAEYMRIIKGTEHPELFLDWLHLYRKKALNIPKYSVERKQEILIKCTSDQAWKIVDAAFTACKPSADKKGIWKRETFIFKKISLQNKVKQMTDRELQDYGDGEDYLYDAIEEAIHHLKLWYFGDDVVGRNAYNQLKHQVTHIRVDFHHGVKKWDIRMQELNRYLVELPCETLEQSGGTATAFSETEMRSVLANCLQTPHHEALRQLDWNIYSRPYVESITKIASLEKQIEEKVATKKEIADLKDGGGSKKRKSSSSSGSSGKSGKKSESNGKSKRSTCDTCGKQHPGECWFADGGKKKKSKSSSFTKKEKMFLMQKLTSSKSVEASDESDSDTKRNSYKVAERAFVMASARARRDDSDSDSSYIFLQRDNRELA